MSFTLPELPYATDALAPHISVETLEFHHGKHHATYVEELNELVKDTPKAELGLEELIRQAEPGPLFNNAAQHWNHSFYWQCLSPAGGGEPSGTLADAIRSAFGDIGRFKKDFEEKASTVFGSGWAWLVRHGDGRLAIEQTPNAENPLVRDQTALLTCDMWEHAYYIDYRNAKVEYLAAFWKVVNWDFAAAQL